MWSHIQIDHPDGPAIVLPKGTTKNKASHLIPLTDLAIAQLPELRPGYPNLFGTIPGKKFEGWGWARDNYFGGRPMEWSPHDLRRTATTRMGGLGVPDDVIERILGHKAQGVTRRR